MKSLPSETLSCRETHLPEVLGKHNNIKIQMSPGEWDQPQDRAHCISPVAIITSRRNKRAGQPTDLYISESFKSLSVRTRRTAWIKDIVLPEKHKDSKLVVEQRRKNWCSHTIRNLWEINFFYLLIFYIKRFILIPSYISNLLLRALSKVRINSAGI